MSTSRPGGRGVSPARPFAEDAPTRTTSANAAPRLECLRIGISLFVRTEFRGRPLTSGTSLRTALLDFGLDRLHTSSDRESGRRRSLHQPLSVDACSAGGSQVPTRVILNS